MSKPERRSVLETCLAARHHGAIGREPVCLSQMDMDGLELTVSRGGMDHILQLAGRGLNLELPAMGRWTAVHGLTALRVGPGTWSLLAVPGSPEHLVQHAKAVLGDEISVVETGHGQVFLRLSGTQARHVLSKGCRLDLHPRVFETGHVARTLIAQIPAMLWQIDDQPTFGLAVPITFAQSFVDFLLAAAAETGCTIAKTSGTDSV